MMLQHRHTTSHMKLLSLILTILIAAGVPVTAASFTVRGRAVDDDGGEPESFATLRIYAAADTLKPLVMGVTATDGSFVKQIDRAGRYRLTLIAVGKTSAVREFEVSAQAPTADLGTIRMATADNILGEVTVEAQRPLVSVEVDRIGYDVQNDVESKTSMVDEMLKKVPMVSVEADGTIKINGSTDFKIYKNGRSNNAYSNNAKEIFKSLPASMIEKIEVITEPGAREDSEGVSAILNIVTVKDMVTKGVMGSASLRYNTANNVPQPSLWLQAQYGRFNISANGGMSISGSRANKSSREEVTRYHETGNTLASENHGSGRTRFGYVNIESSFELDTLNLFTLEFGGFFMRNRNWNDGSTTMTAPSGDVIYAYRVRNHTDPSTWNDFNGAFSYQRSTRRKGENIIFSYRVSNNSSRSESEADYYDFTGSPLPYSAILSDARQGQTEHTLQLDWSHPFANHHNFDVGAKYIFRDNHSRDDRRYVELDTTFSDFTHRTSIGALFADYRLNYQKWGARAGLRYEWSHLSAKFHDGSNDPFSSDLGDLVPNVGLIFNPSQRHSIKLSFGSRIQRPGIWYLNPAVVTTPNSTSHGNPDLESVRRNSLNLSYSLMSAKVTLNLNASYAWSNNSIISVRETRDEHTFSSYTNAGRDREFRIGGYASWRPSAKTSVTINGTAMHQSSENRSLGQKAAAWGGFAYIRLGQKLPLDIDFSVSANNFWMPRGLYSQMKNDWSNLFWNISLQRGFLPEKRLTVNLSVLNPIHKRNPGFTNLAWDDAMDSRSFSRRFNATMLSVSVSYRFGKLQSYVKKTARSISNDDVMGGGEGSSSQGGSGSGQQ